MGYAFTVTFVIAIGYLPPKKPLLVQVATCNQGSAAWMPSGPENLPCNVNELIQEPLSLWPAPGGGGAMIRIVLKPLDSLIVQFPEQVLEAPDLVFRDLVHRDEVNRLA